MKAFLVVLVVEASAIVHDLLPKTTVTIDPNTTFVIFGMRHGNRNPGKFVKTTQAWGQEGTMELTSIGKRQSYGLGRELRSYLGNFVSRNFLPSEATFYTSSANRCQATLQSALAGIYDPVDWAVWNKESLRNWSPVPYTIDDPLLRMYVVAGCTKSGQVWKPILNDTLPDLAKITHDNMALLNYMHAMDGREPTLSNAADISDNIIVMEFLNITYPDWLANPSLPGYTKDTIKSAFQAFDEIHSVRCATYDPCRNLMGGLWADRISKALTAAARGDAKSPKLIGYSSHSEITQSVMILLGIDKTELTTSAGFVIELKNNTKPVMVRLLAHDPNPIDAHVIYKATLFPELAAKADASGWIPLYTLTAYVAHTSFSDYKAACGMAVPQCTVQAASLSSSADSTSAPTVVKSSLVFSPPGPPSMLPPSATQNLPPLQPGFRYFYQPISRWTRYDEIEKSVQ